MSSLFRKILIIYLLILLLGIALSGLIYTNGHFVSSSIDSLISDNLPRSDNLSKLQAAIFAQKPILYEYYASTDRQKFLQDYERNQRDIDAHFHTIHTVTDGNALLKEISQHTDTISKLAEALDNTLNHRQVDWDKAREILAQVSQSEDLLSPAIASLVRLNQEHVFRSGQHAQARTDFMIQLVIGFSIIISIIAIFIGYQVYTYLNENIERRRLAMFPERNPNPVMRMDSNGHIVYTNPATLTLQQQLELNCASDLLPENFHERFKNMLEIGSDFMEFEYPVKDRIMHCILHLLSDLNICHVYITDITKRKQAEERYIHQAYHDHLTGLPNRRMLNERLKLTMENLAESGSMAVLLFRVDRINLILEGRGYDASDGMIQSLAMRIQELLKENYAQSDMPFLFRFEGATFGLLLEKMQDDRQSIILAEQLQQSMSFPLVSGHQEYFLTLSIGASLYPVDGKTPESLIRNAESAVSRVSNSGGNGFQCYTGNMNQMAERWLSLENDLRRALDCNELFLEYQPQFDIREQKISGAEALMRWRRNGNTLVSPAEFIPLAEETGLIITMGEWALRTACLQAGRIIRANHPEFIMAVNISARQFQHPDFIHLVSTTLRETNLPPQNLELEITESMFMHDAEKTISTMQQLRTLGIQLSIDDFGTGYSSLSYLKRFPINKLKVDQSFVRNMCSSPSDASIAKSIVLLGQSLDLAVIAEGVETEDQLAMLREYGCDEIQGYLYSRPLSNTLLESFLKMPDAR